MGKGDKRSKKGKIWRGTYGKTRLTNQKRNARKRQLKLIAKG
jgi:ribosomal small subunit protein bTHX